MSDIRARPDQAYGYKFRPRLHLGGHRLHHSYHAQGPPWEAALATGLAFTVLMNATMMLPNPFFTPVVQRAHTIEPATSNLLYGILLGLLMTWPIVTRQPNASPRPAAAH